METNIKVVGKLDLSKFDKPVKQSPVLSSFPREVIHFFVGKNKRVVGRSETGKIAIISFNYHGQWVKEGDDWLCDITDEAETRIIVMPVTLVKSGIDNFNESIKRLSNLKSEGFRKPFLYPEGTKIYAISK